MDTIAATNEEYSTQTYWENRYANDEGTFDWFKSYADIKDLLHDLIPERSSRVLVLGCGNSTLSDDMWQDEYRNIVNIDYSGVVIGKMKSKYEDRDGMEWLEMDVRELTFENNSFDVAIDKGTMDAMMAVKGDVWNPPPQVVDDCTREIDEAIRVLRPGGIFIYLTFGQPHFRKRFLTREGTTLEIKQLGEAFHYYLYVLRLD
ncbi:hypothetical protein M407DRAFT_142136 [Tulasnella calospora MUT 4182]|uniref:Methyltransferase type 11 domain-containing protein n=2 Tax=Tulasnella calospora MUT 4182 TaxID=1051891 RepID=A0A0C3Q8F0_9AGAM|nr:hypothetical protein M407DRAFT_142136 [Tulasnella calospora MUT 4182]